jgi:hypothetical protein
MRTLAKAGQRRRDHRVAAGPKTGRDVAPTPTAEPGPGDEQEYRHSSLDASPGQVLKGILAHALVRLS